jgi:hypothetical protein
MGCYILAPQQRLYFFPEPQGQGAFRGTALGDNDTPTFGLTSASNSAPRERVSCRMAKSVADAGA